MNNFFNKILFIFGLGIAYSVVITVFFHDSLETSKAPILYFLPIILGSLVGLVVVSLKSSKDRRTKRADEFFLNIIETLAITIDERDRYTHGHSRRVTAMTLQMGAQMGLTFQDLQQLKLAALLHDIGKIGISDSVLLKPGKLTGDEFTHKNEHPEKGARILERMRDGRIVEVIKSVRSHHERFDGKGYPDFLKGEDIPLFARMIAIADSFDAMTTDRPYHESMSTKAAIEEITKEEGKQFDPELVKVFVKLMGDKENPKKCSYLSTCSLFPQIAEKEILKAYEKQYCRANYQGCRRFIMAGEGKQRPDTLLPDGEDIFPS